jgi:glycosyltransferase involved in cell wall biosynthesis
MTPATAATSRSFGVVEDNELRRRLGFITAIPQSVHRGSGCYVGIGTLAAGATALGNRVEMITPAIQFGPFLAERYFFNQALRLRRGWNYDAIIGFDLDGFALDKRCRAPHIANIKGVLGDAVPFERGATRASMALQARWEAEHARRADLVITTSEYCKNRLQELYGVHGSIAVVPELIDLETWRQLFRANPATKPEGEFTVLCVCRFYPRKRLTLLLRAAHLLRGQIPGLQIRVVGGGPEAASLLRMWRELKLQPVVTWVGEVPRHELAREYNRADVFCLPSVQEGFGIVFLEAMAAGKPIVAARAAAVPEVVRHGVLVQPENAEALADGIWRLWRDPNLRSAVRQQQCEDVEKYEMIGVTRRFLREIGRVTRPSTPSESVT